MSQDADLATTLALVALLSDGKLRSGSSLAEMFGVSRAAVWKRVAKLEEMGFEFEKSRASGYALKQPLELLSHTAINVGLTERLPCAAPDFSVVFQVDSTNSVMLGRARSQQPRELSFLLAERQLQGRGRRGRDWHSPVCRNIYLSALWFTEKSLQGLNGLSLAVGVAVAAVLNEEFSVPAMLKWPNDFLVKGAKLGGVLIEVEGDLSGPRRVIIGIGVNVDMPAASRTPVSQLITDMNTHAARRVSRNTLAAAIIAALTRALDEFETFGLPAFLDRWARFDALLGQEVVVSGTTEPWSGTARGVNDQGALLVAVRSETRQVISGDVSVRVVS